MDYDRSVVSLDRRQSATFKQSFEQFASKNSPWNKSQVYAKTIGLFASRLGPT